MSLTTVLGSFGGSQQSSSRGGRRSVLRQAANQLKTPIHVVSFDDKATVVSGLVEGG